MLKNNENSVLFSIGSVIELQKQKEQEHQAELQHHAEARRCREAELAEQARRQAALAEHERVAAAAESARNDWEKQVVEKEAEIRARILADTERELEMLRAEYRDGEPVLLPGRQRMSLAVVGLAALAVIGLGALGLHTLGNKKGTPVVSTATAAAATPAETTPTIREVAPAPMTTVRIPQSAPVKIDKPVKANKPLRITRPPRPRCKWVTITKRVKNELWNHPLNFEGKYKIIKKRVKRCRKK